MLIDLKEGQAETRALITDIKEDVTRNREEQEKTNEEHKKEQEKLEAAVVKNRTHIDYALGAIGLLSIATTVIAIFRYVS